MAFNYAWKEDLIGRPIRFGESFEKPGKQVFRKDKAKRELDCGKMLFAAKDILLLLVHGDSHMRALILSGINVDDSLAANCRLGIEDDRLRAVVDHVHTWLFGAEATKLVLEQAEALCAEWAGDE